MAKPKRWIGVNDNMWEYNQQDTVAYFTPTAAYRTIGYH